MAVQGIEDFYTLEDISLAQSLASIENDLVEVAPPIPTGFDKLDEVLGGGLFPGVTVVAGEPGAGKSTNGLNIASNVADRGRGAVFFSAEMDRTECVLRLLSLYSGEFEWARAWKSMTGVAQTVRMAASKGIDFETAVSKCRDGNVVLNALNNWPLANRLAVLENTRSADIVNIIRRIDAGERHRDGDSFRSPLYVVDYAQALDVDAYERDVSEYERVTAVSNVFRDTAKELRVPILLIAAMNRDSTKDKRPTMHGLRGSSALEYDAKVVLILQKNEVPGFVDMHVVKNRYGNLTDDMPISFSFDGAHGIFKELAN